VLKFTFTTTPSEAQFSRAFTRFGNEVADLTPAFEAIADNFHEGEQEMFASEGGGAGGWEKLSPDYAKWKAANYPGKPILQRTGLLMESLTDRSGPGSKFEMSPMRLLMGTGLKHAGYHQAGTGKMPARPPIKLTETQKNEWMKFIHEHIASSWPGLSGRDHAEITTQDVHFGSI
jgi:phage gpG-like protein